MFWTLNHWGTNHQSTRGHYHCSLCVEKNDYHQSVEIRAVIRNHYLLIMNLNAINRIRALVNMKTLFSNTRNPDLIKAFKLVKIIFENAYILYFEPKGNEGHYMWCKICGMCYQHWTDVAKTNVKSAKGFAYLKKTFLFNSNTKQRRIKLGNYTIIQIGLWYCHNRFIVVDLFGVSAALFVQYSQISLCCFFILQHFLR